MKVDKIIVLCTLILSFIFVLQVLPSLANGPISETQFVEEVNEKGKINFYSHAKIGKINDWARDTKFMLYHNKDTGYTINLELNDDFSAKRAKFSRYTKSIGQIPEDIADDAIEKLKYKPLNKPPVGAFKYTPDLPKVGEPVDFDASESDDPDGKIVSYEWDFGDDEIEKGEVVHHTYSKAATYTVKLTVTDEDGAKSFTTSSISVLRIPTTNKPPVGAFKYTPDLPKVGEPVDFDASESDDPDGKIVSYEWDFGDDEIEKGEVVHHTYSKAATYTVKLTVTDEDGAKSFTTSSISVLRIPTTNKPPVGAFKYTPDLPKVGEPVDFDASESDDPDGKIVSYEWDFGDDEIEKGEVVHHTYSKAATYTVKLTVTDEDGAKSFTTSSISVLRIPTTNKPPVGAFKYTPDLPKVGEPVDFDASESDDPDGKIVSYEWDFGDDEIEKGEVVHHTYSKAATYTVKLTVTDEDGAKSFTTSSISVLRIPTTNKPPVGAFKYTPDLPKVGEPVDFDASESDDPDGKIVSYEWDFGDDEIEKGEVVHHTYSKAATYTVKLTVTDEDGAKSFTASSISVLRIPTTNKPPVGAFKYTPDLPKVGEPVDFDASESDDPDGKIVSYEWDFGDDEIEKGEVVHHTYSKAATYTVKLTVTDEDGAKSFTASSISVLRIPTTNKPPVGAFKYTPDLPKVGEPVDFDASESDDPDGKIVSYEWDFGDDEIEKGEVVHHTYSKAATYTVKLTVTDEDGAKSFTASSISVLRIPTTNKPPVGAFKYTPDLPKVGELVDFDASESDDPDGKIVSYEWDFGDDEIEKGEVVHHTYSKAATYTVKLTVTDEDGAKSFTASSISVLRIPTTNKPPVGAFKYTPDLPKVGELVDFDASESDDPDGKIVSYEWDFGDDEIEKGEVVHHTYSKAATYTVKLTVTDEDGAKSFTASSISVLLSITPTLEPLKARFSYTPLVPEIGKPVRLDASGSTGEITTYTWDFGDGTKTTGGKIINHTYHKQDVYNYKVKLTVTDNEGEEDNDRDRIHVVLKESQRLLMKNDGQKVEFEKPGIVDIIPKIIIEEPAGGNVTVIVHNRKRFEIKFPEDINSSMFIYFQIGGNGLTRVCIEKLLHNNIDLLCRDGKEPITVDYMESLDNYELFCAYTKPSSIYEIILIRDILFILIIIPSFGAAVGFITINLNNKNKGKVKTFSLWFISAILIFFGLVLLGIVITW